MGVMKVAARFSALCLNAAFSTFFLWEVHCSASHFGLHLTPITKTLLVFDEFLRARKYADTNSEAQHHVLTAVS